MVYVSDTAITGQFGSVVALTSTSAVFTSDLLQTVYSFPRSNYLYPKNQLFRVVGTAGTFSRAHKIFDQALLPSSFTVFNNAVAVVGTNYSQYYNGYVLFNTPQTAAGGTANEVQALTSTMTGGSFALTFDDGTTNPQKTGPIAFSAVGATQASNIATALNALTNIGASGVVVTGTGPFTITFSGAAVSNNPYPLMTVDNTLATGGIMTILETTQGTTGFSMSGNYISTSVAANVLTLPETQDWKITKNSNVVKNPVYGTGFMRNIVGMAEGTFEFYENSVDDTLYTVYQRTGGVIHMALYEKVNAAVPRLWIVGGNLSQTPIDNPAEGRNGGQIMGTLWQWPCLLRETL